MATLFNTKIKDTYQSLLKLEDNTILTTTVKNVTDGLGNASPLYMSTTRIGIGTTTPTAKFEIVDSAGSTGNALLISHPSAPATLSYNPTASALTLSKGYSYLAINTFGGGSNALTLGSGGPHGYLDLKENGTTYTYLTGTSTGNAGYSYFLSQLGVGTATTLGAKLSIKGSGSTSATTSLLVQNSGGTTSLQVTDDRTTFVNGLLNVGTIYSGIECTNVYSAIFQNGGSGGQIRLSMGGTNYLQINQPKDANSGVISGTINTITTPISYGYSLGTASPNLLSLNPSINNTGTYSGTFRGIYYNPTLTSLTGTTHIALETVTGNVLLGTTSGNVGIGTITPGSKLTVDGNISVVNNNSIIGYVASNQGMYLTGGAGEFRFINGGGGGWYYTWYQNNGEQMRLSTANNLLIGTTTDAGYKLDVNGTLRSGIIYLTGNNGRIQYSTDMYMQFPAQGGPIAGVFADGGYGWNFQSSQIYSTLRPGNGTTTAASWSLSESVKSFGKNTFYITTDLTNASGGSATGETITLLNVNLGGPTAGYAYKPSLKLKAGNSGTHSGADQYARSGDLYLESGDANSGTANNVAGGTIYLSSGRGTGTGTPGNIILSTSTVTTSGTTLQTLTERMRINGSGNVMINSTTDNGYKLNVNGTAFVSELITTGGMVKHNPYTIGVRALEIYSGIGHGGNTGVWASMYSTGVYGNGFDSYIGTQGYGVIGDPTNNAAAQYVNNIGVSGGATLSNATGVYGTSGLFGKATTFRNASAALEVNSTTHGFLPPRMTAAQRGALTTITGFGTITGGSGYVDGTYYGVSITGGSGQNAYARIVVSGGSVTSVALESGYLGGLSGGFGYTNGASVSASNTQLGGSGAGFSVIINASTPVGMMVYQTDATEGLYIYKSTGWTFIA